MSSHLSSVGPSFPTTFQVLCYGLKKVDCEHPQRFAELLEIRDPPKEHPDWKYIIFTWWNGGPTTCWYAFENLAAAERSFQAASSIKGRVDADAELFRLFGGLIMTGFCAKGLPWFYKPDQSAQATR